MNLRALLPHSSLLLAFRRAPAPRCRRASRRSPPSKGSSEYRLDNGLRVVLFPDAGSPSTSVNVTYLVGSRHEKYGETGMAHLLEHMLFKGTPTRGNIWAEMSKRGMRNNGSTWYDRTNYYETFNASPADLEWAISMEADRMVNSRVDRKDLDTEMTVVRNEMERGENNPSDILFERADRLLVSLAQLRQGNDRRALGRRKASTSSACARSTGCTTSRTTRSLVDRGRVRSRPDARLDREVFRRDSQARAHAAAAVHAGTGPGRRAHRDDSPRRRPAARRRGVSHACPARIRTTSRSTRSPRS